MSVRIDSWKVIVLVALAVAFASGCSKQPRAPRVWIPPRIDLARFGTLGMLEFDTPGSPGLGLAASREFLGAIQSAQPGTPVLELGGEKQALAALQKTALDPEAIRALGEKHGLGALIVGSLEAERVAPSLAFDADARWVSAGAELEGKLSVRIFDARSGATIWSESSQARQPLGRIDVSGAAAGFGASHPDEAKQHLVRILVERATGDFWGYWD
jgi:hypothetical protein